MVIAILNDNLMIVGIGYLRGKSAIDNLRRIMPHVKHVQMYISHNEWIPEDEEWTQASITYEFVYVPYIELDTSFSKALDYARNVNKPTIIMIENKLKD